ncbi:unnamed protein product [Urochloa decumbens]|uniref:Disease resistance protein RPM1 n=1 Tax=Urochloa decumbens TaxID=240449 RepID=A0ABC9GQ51_9POAL
MEATALSLGKSVLDGALGYAKSAVAEAVALQLGVQRDHAFIRDELAMMRSFLMAAQEDRDEHKAKVFMTWVQQVRDVAYDAEDCLQDFVVHLHKSWWRLTAKLHERRRIAKQMKELRARVEDVSHRNLGYQLITTSASKPETAAELSNITAEAIFGFDEARRSMKQHDKPKELVHLINMGDEDLTVISVWGTSKDFGQASIINEAYDSPYIKNKFPCRAWVRISHPFNPYDFIQCLVEQFKSAAGVSVVLETVKTREKLGDEFTKCVNEKSYLIVIDGLSTFADWNRIKGFFPNNKRMSRIIVCTPQAEVASLCAGQQSRSFVLKQLSADQTVYVFCKENPHDQAKLSMQASSSNAATTSTDDILEPESVYTAVTRSLTRLKTMATYWEEYKLIGREKEKSEMVKLICNQSVQELQVISVWGMGGLGKTTLVKDIYESQELISTFEKRACVTILRPFILKDLLKSLVMQLSIQTSSENKAGIDFLHSSGNTSITMGVEALTKELARVLEGKMSLIVLDDMSSTAEWDQIMQHFPKLETCRILITTREESIARHCSEKQENVYKLKVLEYKDALQLFERKVFKETIDLDKYPDLIEEANQILKKCNGLPLAIATIGGFLANQPKLALEWRKLNDHISAELEINPDLEAIRTILGKSYDGLPYHLKSCFLYLSLFPEDHKVSRRLLVRRWNAEGYLREIRDKSAEEIGDTYFMELIGRSMIMPFKKSYSSRREIDSCQVHDLMREIGILKSTEEHLVCRLEEGYNSNTQGKVRHLAVSKNWNGSKNDFESAVDLSHIRSLTVFAQWRSFFISKEMSLLRVLDLEGATGLVDHHLEQIASLIHLKYISLRGCDGIYHLPNSWGNLQQLQTLDMKGTRICKLPKTIIKLRKLQYLFVGDETPFCVNSEERVPDDLNKLCMACCAPNFLKDVEDMDGDPNRHDVCCFWCHVVIPTLTSRRLHPHGVVVPRGINKLKDLRTLGLVNIASGRAILHDIRKLTQLRKLAVRGVDEKNSQELGSTLASLSRLESLSMQSSSGESGLYDCLDGVPSPLKNLQSLNLKGSLIQLPQWIVGLQSLVKLVLHDTVLIHVDPTMQILGKLPNLAILWLRVNTFYPGELRLSFHKEGFPNLIVLQLSRLAGLESVEFEEGATLKLEFLSFVAHSSCDASAGMFSGLASLPSLKEFMLDCSMHGEDFLKHVQDLLARNPKGPILKMSSSLELL